MMNTFSEDIITILKQQYLLVHFNALRKQTKKVGTINITELMSKSKAIFIKFEVGVELAKESGSHWVKVCNKNIFFFANKCIIGNNEK